MAEPELYLLTIAQLSALIQTREVSPVEVAQAYLERIQRLDDRLNHFITVLADHSLAAARQAEAEITAGNHRGPLHGIPITLKDLFWTKGIRTTAGSKVLEHHVPDYDATVVSNLKAAGAYIMGKLNMQEFGMGPRGVVSHFGPNRNPWDLERVCGGSSSGSGGSVAAATSLGALGSDTGGSVRIPAAICGVVGFKPTYGLVSRHGVLPNTWTFDTVGPFARSVEDTAILLQAMAGYDPLDSSSVGRPIPDYRAGLNSSVKGLRMAVIKEITDMPHHPEVSAAFNQALQVLEQMGASVHQVSIPTMVLVSKFHPVISMSEATVAHHATYLEHREEFGPEVQTRLDLGLLLTPADYLTAQRARTILQRETAAAFQKADVLLTPTCAIPAPRLDQTEYAFHDGSRENVTSLLSRNTRPINDTGHPAISVPCGFAGGMPVGLQMIGKPFQDGLILQVAHQYQRATEWHTMRPSISSAR